MQRFTLFLFSSFIFLSGAMAQTSPNEIFEQAKGSLSTPIAGYREVIDMNDRRHYHYFNQQDSSLSFITDSAAQAKAVYAGTVVSIWKFSSYYILTRFGDYFICYSNLEKPDLKKGDQVQAGQPLATLTKEINQQGYQLDFAIYKLDKEIDAGKWLGMAGQQLVKNE